MPHIVLAGYLGCGNLGDDAVMLGFVNGLGDGFQYTVLAGDPSETMRLTGLRAVSRRGRSVDEAIESADAVVFPGGSVFQDSTSVRSVAYYHSIVRKAKGLGKKVLLVGQGVGPVTTFFGKRLTAASFTMADLVVARDPAAAQLLKGIGVRRHIYAGADSAFLLPSPTLDADAGGFGVGGMRSVAIAPRPVHRKGFDEATFFGEFCRMVYSAGAVPTLLEMDPAEDGPLIEAISKVQGGRIPGLRKLGTPTVVQQRLARMDGIVAMRLHAGILGATVGVPPLMVSYDPKVAAFARELDASPVVPLEGITPARLFAAYEDYVRALPKLRTAVARRREEMVRAAETNVELAREILLGKNPVSL